MTREDLLRKFPHASESFIKANCDLSGGLPHAERKSDPPQALDSHQTPKRPSKKRVVVCIEIIAVKRRVNDDDNLVSGAKHLRDCIATSLGVDDGDKRLRWSYGQCQTTGREQTIVRISLK